MSDVDVLAVGEAMAVLSPDPPAPLRHAATLAMTMAGAEANVVVQLAALGLRTAFTGRVGADPFGELIRDRLAAAGVRAELAVHPTAPTGVYFKNPAPGGTSVHYYRAGSAASTMDTRVWAGCPAARVVHLSGITPALSASCRELVAAALAERPVPGAVMSFDVNHRPGLWRARDAAGVLADLANQADLVFVGLDEAAALWGTRTPDEVREVIGGPGTVVVKDGGTGATAYVGPTTYAVPAPAVEIVEPVGAGDAFAAGYLFGLLTGHDPETGLRLGHRMAGVALRTAADVGALPAAADLLAWATATRAETTRAAATRTGAARAAAAQAEAARAATEQPGAAGDETTAAPAEAIR